jgi:hypothetical protein
MYRACSTWQYDVASEILERHRQGDRLGFIEGIYFDRKVAADRPVDAWGILKAHDFHDRFVEEIAAGRALAIYSYRDLRDVVFSYMHKTGSTFDQLVARGFFELCLENDRAWRAVPGILVQSYESLIAEPVAGVEAIARLLEVSLAEGEAEALAEQFSWDSNRKRIDALAETLRAQGVDLSSEDQSRFDPVTLLHWNHLRKGGTGGWRTVATPRQLGVMAHFLADWLVANGYEADDSRAEPLDTEERDRALERVSYAWGQEDILLDRLFRGKKGTYVHFDADRPVEGNATYLWYDRGWRGTSIGSTLRSRSGFVELRPADLNLALDLEAVDSAVALPGLIEQYRIPPPEFLTLGSEAPARAILSGLPLETWRPKVIVLEAEAPAEQGFVESRLGPLGYRLAAEHEGRRYYPRSDWLERSTALVPPVSASDRFRVDVHSADLNRAIAAERREALARRSADRAKVAFEVLRESAEADRAAYEADRRVWAQASSQFSSELAELRRQLAAQIAQRESEVDALQASIDGLTGSLRSDQASYQRERESFAQERASFFEERALWELERTHYVTQLSEAQQQLRPYHLIDRLRLINTLHRRARTLKRKRSRAS